METVRILKNEWFAKFARKQGIADAALIEAIRRADAGVMDANLGHGLIKQRVARAGKGKSSSFRVVIAYRIGDLAVFLFGFAKSAQANLTDREMQVYSKAAEITLGFTSAQINAMIADGSLIEVKE